MSPGWMISKLLSTSITITLMSCTPHAISLSGCPRACPLPENKARSLADTARPTANAPDPDLSPRPQAGIRLVAACPALRWRGPDRRPPSEPEPGHTILRFAAAPAVKPARLAPALLFYFQNKHNTSRGSPA